MTIHEYSRVLREHWGVILVSLIIGTSAAGVAFFARPPQYTAQLTMYVSTQGADTTQAAYQGAQLSEDRIASYTALLTSSRVTSDVIHRLGLPETPNELAKKMTASSALNSVLLDVTVTDPDPRRATDVANAVGDVFPDLVSELERPTKPEALPAVAVRVVQPAQIPNKPSSTGLLTLIALGTLAGIGIGVCLAFLRNALDITVRSPEHLKDATGTPNLGTIAYDAGVPSRPLIVHEDPQSSRSEAFRQLRTNLQFLDVDTPRKAILVTSALPDEGKTTTTVNLAIALASAGTRVLLIEADLRRPKVATLLGIEHQVGLTNVLLGRVSASQVIQPWGNGGLDVLTSGPLPPNPSELLASRQMHGLISELKHQYDIVLLDCPPLLPVADTAAMALAADGAIMICRFRKTRRHQVEAAVVSLRNVSSKVFGTVLTMVPSSGPRAYSKYNSYYSNVLSTANRAAERNINLRQQQYNSERLLNSRNQNGPALNSPNVD